MRYVARTSHVALLAALLGTTVLAACGGGGKASVPPVPQPASQQGQNRLAQGKVTAIIPATTSSQAHARKPQYLNASDPNSAIIVSVQPTDPAEAAQWATQYGTSGFTLCYNLYTGGTPNPALNPVAVSGGVQVSFAIPAVPGNDTFSITQYDGQCSATNPYVPPVPSPNANGNGVLAAAPPITVNINGGIANNFNVQLTACGASSSNGGPCSNATPAPGTPPTTVQLGASLAAVYLAGSSPGPKSLVAPIPIPISEPIREQALFLAAGSKVGVPIPIVGLDSAGYVIAGSPATGSGTLPKVGDKITLTHTEAGPSGTVTGHAQLFLVDATTGAIAQAETPTTPITLTQLNALDAADAALGGTVGDPYVVVLSTDGANAKAFVSSTVTLNATLNGTAIPAQTSTLREQGAIYTAKVAVQTDPTQPGYADAGGPYNAASEIVSTFGTTLPVAAQGLWVTNGNAISEAGVGRFAVAGAGALTGEAYDSNPSVNRIFAVDNNVTLGSLQTTPATNATGSGLYVFDPVAHTSLPVAVQYQQTNTYIGFQNPQGVAYIPGGYLYVVESNRLWAIDPQSNGAGTGLTTVTNGGTTYVQAEAIAQVPVTGLAGGAAQGLSAIGIAPSTLLLADPSNNRIASINVNTGAVSTFATGGAFAGISPGPTAGTYYACDTSGQLYVISSGTATSLGLATGAITDGPIGLGTTLPYISANAYAVQGTANNFFGSAPSATLPYKLPPFAAGGPVFAPAAQTAVAGAPLKFAADTNAVNIGATQIGAVHSSTSVVYVTAAMAGTNAALTPESFLFTDSGRVRTLVP